MYFTLQSSHSFTGTLILYLPLSLQATVQHNGSRTAVVQPVVSPHLVTPGGGAGRGVGGGRDDGAGRDGHRRGCSAHVRGASGCVGAVAVHAVVLWQYLATHTSNT